MNSDIISWGIPYKYWGVRRLELPKYVASTKTMQKFFITIGSRFRRKWVKCESSYWRKTQLTFSSMYFLIDYHDFQICQKILTIRLEIL